MPSSFFKFLTNNYWWGIGSLCHLNIIQNPQQNIQLEIWNFVIKVEFLWRNISYNSLPRQMSKTDFNTVIYTRLPQNTNIIHLVLTLHKLLLSTSHSHLFDSKCCKFYSPSKDLSTFQIKTPRTTLFQTPSFRWGKVIDPTVLFNRAGCIEHRRAQHRNRPFGPSSLHRLVLSIY